MTDTPEQDAATYADALSSLEAINASLSGKTGEALFVFVSADADKIRSALDVSAPDKEGAFDNVSVKLLHKELTKLRETLDTLPKEGIAKELQDKTRILRASLGSFLGLHETEIEAESPLEETMRTAPLEPLILTKEPDELASSKPKETPQDRALNRIETALSTLKKNQHHIPEMLADLLRDDLHTLKTTLDKIAATPQGGMTVELNPEQTKLLETLATQSGSNEETIAGLIAALENLSKEVFDLKPTAPTKYHKAARFLQNLTAGIFLTAAVGSTGTLAGMKYGDEISEFTTNQWNKLEAMIPNIK